MTIVQYEMHALTVAGSVLPFIVSYNLVDVGFM